MADEPNDPALIQVLAERLDTQRLPRTLSLKEKVDRGETLTDFDIAYLDEVFADADHIRPLVDRHPEWQELAAKLIRLYHEITAKALENEKAKGGGSP